MVTAVLIAQLAIYAFFDLGVFAFRCGRTFRTFSTISERTRWQAVGPLRGTVTQTQTTGSVIASRDPGQIDAMSNQYSRTVPIESGDDSGNAVDVSDANTAPSRALLESDLFTNGLSMLERRTATCLDLTSVLGALQSNAVTVRGSKRCYYQAATSAQEATEYYRMVEQITPHLEAVPLRSAMDIQGTLRSIEINGSPPDKEALAVFSRTIEEMLDIRSFIVNPVYDMPLYSDIAQRLSLPEEVVTIFKGSFDDDDNLNADKYPVLKTLRIKIDALRIRIEQTIQSILRSDNMRDKLADSGYVEIEGRYCLMLKNTYKRGIGIVHDSSNSGRSLYVEPFEIVEPTNEMRSVIADLRVEENKIYFDMIKTIARYRKDIQSSLEAAADVDVFRAKAKLGNQLRGVTPEVLDEGCIRCTNSRHPVLLLRGTSPVGNNIELSKDATALVISGPNAGGKTVILKTAGLFALMARYAIPIPAREGARVDFMEVMADIGDMQTVSEDLSTFSGHLTVCREMLEKVQQRKTNGTGCSLVLLDEIGTGTDPAQGAALAQAVLEELVQQECRVIVTTHYQRIKELAAGDDRFRVAAMEFVDNRPTYRLKMGYIGESYALEAAQRMCLPPHVLDRAHLLLDDESRQILALQKKLEEETDKARALQARLDEKIAGLKQEEDDIELARLEMEEQIRRIREGHVEQFLVDLRAKERELEQLLHKAQQAVSPAAANPTNSVDVTTASKAEREKIVHEVKANVKALRVETEVAVVEITAADLGVPLETGVPVEEGATLVVLEKGGLFGAKGIAVQRNKGRGKVHLRVAGAEVKIERHLVGIPHSVNRIKQATGSSAGGAAASDSHSSSSDDSLSAKERRMLQILKDELVDVDKLTTKTRSFGSRKVTDKRSVRNTVDVREKSLPDAQEAILRYLEDFVNRGDGESVVFVQHGNSRDSEALKPKLRAWLKRHPLAAVVVPAELSNGGDGYTAVALEVNLN